MDIWWSGASTRSAWLPFHLQPAIGRTVFKVGPSLPSCVAHFLVRQSNTSEYHWERDKMTEIKILVPHFQTFDLSLSSIAVAIL
jgi:hypothetical protein